MSLIRDLERRLEAVFEGFFTRQFRSGLQPVEIAKRLAREMDEHRTVSVNRVYAPNRFLVFVGQEDAARLTPFMGKLCEELGGFLLAHAKREGYSVVGRPDIVIEDRTGLGLGEFVVESALVDKEEEPVPNPSVSALPPKESSDETRVFRAPKPTSLILPAAGITFALKGERTTIGRASENDIILPDQSVSRSHAEVALRGEDFFVRDLGSRNGTFLNGRSISESILVEGDEIRVGMSTLIFRSGSRV